MLVLSRVEFFFDFPTYEGYINGFTFFERFDREPLSAVLMYFAAKGELGAEGYYYITWYMVFIPIVWALYKKHHRAWFVLSLFVFFNPVMLIVFQTPRQFVAVGFFLLSILFSGWIRIFSLICILLAHTVSGLFVCGLFFVYQLQRNLYPLLFGLLLIAYYLFLQGYYDFYIDSHDRGVGRLFYTILIFAIFSFLTFLKKGKEKEFIVNMFFFVVAAFILSPFGSRLFIFFILLAILYLFTSLHKFDSKLILSFSSLSSASFSLFFIYHDMYGYG